MSVLVCVYVYYIFYFLLLFFDGSPCLYSISSKCEREREGKNDDGINVKQLITYNTHTGVLNKMETTPMVLHLPFLKYLTMISNSCTYHLSISRFFSICFNHSLI